MTISGAATQWLATFHLPLGHLGYTFKSVCIVGIGPLTCTYNHPPLLYLCGGMPTCRPSHTLCRNIYVCASCSGCHMCCAGAVMSVTPYSLHPHTHYVYICMPFMQWPLHVWKHLFSFNTSSSHRQSMIPPFRYSSLAGTLSYLCV